MTSIFRIINYLILLIIAFSLIIPTGDANGYWVLDYSFDSTSPSLINSFDTSYHSGEYSEVQANDPSAIQIYAFANSLHHGAYATFTYDLGDVAAGYEHFLFDSSLYKVVIRWRWNGYWTDNNNPDNVLKITYTIYYLHGNTPVSLYVSSVEYTSSQSWSGSSPFEHTITRNNAIYNEELYLKIQLEIVAKYEWPTFTYPLGQSGGGDFHDNSHSPPVYYMVLESVSYYHYVDLNNVG